MELSTLGLASKVLCNLESALVGKPQCFILALVTSILLMRRLGSMNDHVSPKLTKRQRRSWRAPTEPNAEIASYGTLLVVHGCCPCPTADEKRRTTHSTKGLQNARLSIPGRFEVIHLDESVSVWTLKS